MKAVVLAAGEGERLKPLTATRPKHLLPIGNKPLLELLLEGLREAGIREVILVVGYMGDSIQKTFGDGKRLHLKTSYIKQERLLGTGAALKLAEEEVSDEEFLVTYGDLFVESSVFSDVIDTYRQKKTNVLAVVAVDKPADYGVIQLGAGGKMIDLIEKPLKTSSRMANAGVYVLSPTIFKEIENTAFSTRGEIEITDPLQRLAKSKEDIYSVQVDRASWIDIGRPWDLLVANDRYLEQLDPAVNGVVEKNVQIKGRVRIEEDAVIRSGSYLEGPLLVGRGSQIGPNCFLRPSTALGVNVRIGNGCEIKNTIIFDRTHAPHLSYVGDSIIGEACNLGAGTVVGNVKLDNSNVKSIVKGTVVDSDRRKLGTIIGDNVKTGINTSIMPGIKVWPNSQIGAHALVTRDVPSNVRVIVHQHVTMESLD
ncbi:MAG: bifunctional sugar-1-phosphate nucleotidylyltransferase/acetyltransferase [Candidatus Bathyarchaeia archaeon]